MTDYNAELQALREKVARKHRAEALLSDLQTQLADLRAEEWRLAKVLRDEQADVDALEKPGLVSLFYAAVGLREGKLDKEKAEAYAAALKHGSALRQLRAAEDEADALRSELSELSGAEAEFDRVLALKEAKIRQSDPGCAADLRRIEDRLGDIGAQVRELGEAALVGEEALSRISAIEGELGSAEGWGTWDLLGGGLLSDIAKHSHLDDAQTMIDTLQDTLRRYRTELSDVTVQADIQAQIEGFLRFADYFFDGLFADWAVLDSIHGAQEQIASTRSQVEGVQHRLREMKQELDAEAGKLEAERSEIVLKA